MLKQLRTLADGKRPPKPTIVDLRAGGAAREGQQKALTHFALMTLSPDYLSPQSFSVNLLECMKNDWELTGESLQNLLPGNLPSWRALLGHLFSSVTLSGRVAGAELALDFKKKLLKDPSPLQTITEAYIQLANEAKKRRRPDDPWPVIIIDEANRLSSWKDKETLEQLLTFFVFLSKQEQLAHGEPARPANPLIGEASLDPRSDPCHERHISAAAAG